MGLVCKFILVDYSGTIFEGLFTEEGIGAGKAIFEGGFKFTAYEAQNNFDAKYSAVRIEEYQSASPSTQ